MEGLAQRLYRQRQQGESNEQEGRDILDRLVEQGRLDYIDLAFAETFVKEGPEIRACLCYLFHSARQGHLCVKREGSSMDPDPLASWLLPGEDLSVETAVELRERVLIGWDRLQSYEDLPIKYDVKRLYLQRFWVAESRVVEQLKRLVALKPELSVDLERMRGQIRQSVETGLLELEQGQAIELAAQGTVTFVTGGPGTGKTYTAGKMLRMLCENTTLAEGQKLGLALAAPTGKAAANLASSLSLDDLVDKVRVSPPSTLHSLLQLSPHERRQARLLEADIVLVDESSMIDAELMGELLASIKDGARLIFLGDKDQLPPVECGGVFADLTRNPSETLKQHVCHLKKCRRIESKTLLDFASNVNGGAVQVAMSQLSAFPVSNDPDPQKLASAAALRYYALAKDCQEPEATFSAFSTYRLLSPLRKGNLGVVHLNRSILSLYLGLLESREERILPIMVVANDYRMQLFNGEVGVLVTRTDTGLLAQGRFSAGDYALFPDRTSDQGLRSIPALLLPKTEWAFCLSVHKSQGSEFSEVQLVLPPSSEIFGREVLYTAVTRARQKLSFCSTEATLRATICSSVHRVSGVSDRI